MFHISRDSFRNGVLGFGIRQDKITDLGKLRSWVDAQSKVKSRLFTLIREDQLNKRDIILSCKTKKEAEEYIQSNSELNKKEAMSFENPIYTPYVNVQKKSAEIFKDSGISIEKTTPNGGYLVRQKNGELIMEPLNHLLHSQLSADPMVKAVYDTKAYVQRKNLKPLFLVLNIKFLSNQFHFV
jgi:hypothetical protein